MKAHRDYYIINGVRRALAAREAGRLTVPAIVYEEGRPPVLHARMRLAYLLSPKATVERNTRFLQIEPPILEPIQVEVAGARGQASRTVRLSNVRLV